MLDDRYYDLEVLFFDAAIVKSKLPLPGHFTLPDVVQLVNWQEIVSKMYIEIYGEQTVEDYIEERDDAWTSHNFPENVQVYISKEDPGVRFGEDSNMYLCVELDYLDSVYTMFIPVTKGNSSLFLMGVAWMDGPERLLHASEYAVTVERKGFKTKRKYHFSASKKRESANLDEHTFYSLIRLEDMAIYALMELNRERLVQAVGNDELFDHFLFVNWTIAFIDCWKHKKYIDPIYEIPETFQDLYLFSEWALDNGYMKESKLEPKDYHLPASPDNYKWVPKKQTFPVTSLQESKAQFRPTRYYPDLQYVTYLPFFTIADLQVTSQGKTQSLAEWYRETRIPVSVLYMRHMKGEADLLGEPSDQKAFYGAERTITHNGETKQIHEWADELNIPVATIISRIRYGWEEHELLLPPGTKRGK